MMDGHTSTIVLLSSQRSGSHALKSILSNHEEITAFPESFHRARHETLKKSNYFYFLKKFDGQIESQFPDRQEDTLCRYLDYLKTLENGEQYQILDIKYNHLNALTSPNRSILRPPYLLTLFKKHGIPVIFLRRTNKLRQYLSSVTAKATGVWHVKTSDWTSPQPQLVDCNHMLKEMRRLEEEEILIERSLRSCSTFRCTYEELFPGKDKFAILDIYSWLDLKNCNNLESGCRKQNPFPIRSMVKNYNDIAKVLRENGYQRFLEEEGVGTTFS